MPSVPGHELIGPRRVGAIQELVVVRVLRYQECA